MEVNFHSNWPADWGKYYKQIEIIDVTIANNFTSITLFNFTIEITY